MTAEPRWADHVLDDRFVRFWENRAKLASVRLLVIAGIGFDPRCLSTLQALSQAGWRDRAGYLALHLDGGASGAGPESPAQQAARRNSEKLATLGFAEEAVLDVALHDDEGYNVAGRRTLSAIAGVVDAFTKYTDVLLDISGMPRSVFFPLTAYLLKLSDAGTIANLHVSVLEDPDLEAKIVGKEYGQADFLHTFGPKDDNSLIWVPIVGGDERIRLEKVHAKLQARCIEICPVLPFPARSLRRVDDILVRHAELLFESFLVSKENLLLCDERTPFDVYRKALELEEYYKRHLATIGGVGAVTTVVSPLASKTLSLGLCLAAIERGLPVCHVDPGSYDLRTEDPLVLKGEPVEVWLAGEPYA